MALHTGHLKESLHETFLKPILNKVSIGKVLTEPGIQAGIERILSSILKLCLKVDFDLAQALALRLLQCGGEVVLSRCVVFFLFGKICLC